MSSSEPASVPNVRATDDRDSTLRAVIWDVDGTIAETERDGHRVAFNRAFAEFGLPWSWNVQTYGRLLCVAGGRERLLSWMDVAPGAPNGDDARERLAVDIHRSKGSHYRTLVEQGAIAARPGVVSLVDQIAASGTALALASTTGRANVEALFPRLFGAQWRDRFSVVVCAEDAPTKKPDPQVYQLALERLGLPAQNVLAIEDSPAGLHAARCAGIGCLVTRGGYFAHADFSGAVHVCSDLADAYTLPGGVQAPIDLMTLRYIHHAGHSLLVDEDGPLCQADC